MIVVANSLGLVGTTLVALNNLTHANAFDVAGAAGAGVALTPLTPPGDGYTRSACFGLIYRMMINPFVCTIETSPGLDLGTLPDVSDPESSGSMPGGAITQARDSARAGNTAHYGSSQSWKDYLTGKEDQSGKGSGAKIVWNPYSASTLNWVGGQAVRASVPAFIVLAHELSHADRMMRGASLVGVVGKTSPPAYSARVPTTTYETMVDIEHIEMVGFSSSQWRCKDPDVITENQMRVEHHQPLRVNY